MQELFCLLTEKTKQGIENLNLNHLQEIRLRVGKPVCVLYCFENYFLTPKGLSKISKDAIVPTQNEVENTLLPLKILKGPKDYSIHLCLFCCLAYRVIVTIFLNSIYMR